MQVMSLICRRQPTWLARCLGVGDARLMPLSHVTQMTLADDDHQQQQQQQVRDVTHDVTADVSQCWTVTEMHERRQESPVVGDKVDSDDYGRCDLTKI